MRSIIIMLSSALISMCFAGSVIAEEEGFRAIFDGKTLDGWDGDPRLWRVEDGAIVGETTPEKRTEKNTFLIWRGGLPGDFVLKLQFKLANHNSGVQYRSREEPKKWGRWVLHGYQADIADKSTPYTGIFYEEGGRGILAKRGERIVIGDDHKPRVVGKTGDPDQLTAAIKPEDWNDYEIIAEGNRLKHIINGRLMVDVADDDAERRSMGGLIGFQLHAGPPMKVRFRNIRIKTLLQDEASNESDASKKKIVFIAGPASHNYGEHEHRGGCLLLAERIEAAYPNVETVVFEDGWPADRNALNGADAIVIFSDGSKSHPMLRHLGQVEKLMKRGAGLVCIHYAVTAPLEKGAEQMKSWIGANYEPHWSVNPFWTAEFQRFPDHPAARGLRPFALEDEWYFNMRFIEGMEGVSPILTAVPPDAAREGPNGPSSGNPTVRSQKGKAEHLAWARTRPDGGRGFGTTGGHWHWNWANDNFRKTVLNGIAWTAKLDIPANGVPSKTPSLDELIGGIAQPRPADFDREEIRKRIESWR
ncbi:MAG: DUF1080 domain-containing protein [Pirellulaceae bacterium]|nr:DUF1080 domain-containing protein [Pirellulaceae bacterium]